MWHNSNSADAKHFYRTAILVAGIAGCVIAHATAAETMPSAQQNSLVQKYCAVCHTDVAKNGGLSLQHYDAAQPDPPLAAMLLSKLRNGAMGAAGAGVPDAGAQKAWLAATTAQAEQAKKWTVLRASRPDSKAVVTASMVRDVAPRKPEEDAPVYRLMLTCDETSSQGEMKLTWSPSPQTDRTFFVSTDGKKGIPIRLEGREQRMGNGAALTSGLAAVALTVPWPEKTLTVNELFLGESVEFPLGDLPATDRQQLAACFAR